MKLAGKSGRYLAEAAATFALVFLGTGAIASNAASGGQLTHVGISLVFGLAVLAMIYAVGHVSGAHMNPAVTLAFAAIGRLSWREVPCYVTAQVLGAASGSAVIRLIFGPGDLGATMPSDGWPQSFVMEFVLTAILLFIVVSVAHDARAEGIMAGVAIGATVTCAAFIGGPVSGASLNPARSLGPALIGGDFRSLWLYLVAPTLGAVAGAFLYERVRRAPGPEGRKACC